MITNPIDDKARIEQTKDDLLKGACAWVFNDQGFLHWRNDSEPQLLWIKGNPGKGKTMMMIALIDELSNLVQADPGSSILSYFFCQNTDTRLSSSVSILRGLIYLLAFQRRELIHHVWKRYNSERLQLFEGPNAVYALWEILRDMSSDPSFKRVYLLVDALDECDNGLEQLLGLIMGRNRIPTSKVKWLVSSRYKADFEKYFGSDASRSRISLELNHVHISQAVQIFIDFKVQKLAELKRYNANLRKEVERALRDKAKDTFLWVALVCKQLESVSLHRTRNVLKELPPGLEPLYERMMEEIHRGNDSEDAKLCIRVLRSATVAFRPLYLQELAGTADLPQEQFDDIQAIKGLVELCGSFLTIRDNRVDFVHLSARDYFRNSKGSRIFPTSMAEEHYEIMRRSLQAMSVVFIREDICNLQKPGALAREVKDKISKSPLMRVEYACRYWADHLAISRVGPDMTRSFESTISDDGIVHIFLKEHLLHWLEGMGLLDQIFKAGQVIKLLQSLINVSLFQGEALQVSPLTMPKTEKSVELSTFLNDSSRFILSNGPILAEMPLQVYSSALIFSSRTSQVRKQFWCLVPKWIETPPAVPEILTLPLQTLSDHSDFVTDIAFSPKGRLIVSASSDRTIKLWDPVTGSLLHTFKGHLDEVTTISFLSNGKLIASASDDETVRIWDLSTGHLLLTLEEQLEGSHKRAFSEDGNLLATVKHGIIRLWDLAKGTLLHTLEDPPNYTSVVAVSPDGKLIASISQDAITLWNSATGGFLYTFQEQLLYGYIAFSKAGNLLVTAKYGIIKIRDLATGILLHELKDHSKYTLAVAFSPDGKLVASLSQDMITLWNPATGDLLYTLGENLDASNVIAFSPDGNLVAASSRTTLMLWDPATGVLLHEFEGHLDQITALAFSPDSELLASTSADCRIRLWDLSTGPISSTHTFEGYLGEVSEVAFSPDGKLIASASHDRTISLSDLATGNLLQTFESHLSTVTALDFSADGNLLASTYHSGTVSLWNTATGDLLHTFESDIMDYVTAVAFSPDRHLFASAYRDGTIKLWDLATGDLLQTLGGHLERAEDLTFSLDGKLVISASYDNTVKIWDPATGGLLRTLEGHLEGVGALVLSADGNLVASASNDYTIKLWDLATGELLQTLKDDFLQMREDKWDWAKAVALSPDGNLVASAFSDSTVRLWNVRTGTLLQTLDVGASIKELSFSKEGPYLETDRGTLSIQSLHIGASSLQPQPPHRIFVERDLITLNMENLLWLPTNYEAKWSAVRGNIVVLGHYSGRVSFIKFNFAHLKG